ncbi:MAG: hypothetical protein IJO50_04880, partial [Clostridia bacterium]|nr:hypothetical protein [Clostridia bacterium]
VESPKDFLGYIDDAVWGPCMNSVIVDYMINSEEEYVINTEEDITKYIREIADQYLLHAHQSYVADAILLSEGKYCVLLSMADIHAQLKVPEMEKMFIAPYIAIVYDKTADQFRYFILEKSFEDYYALCTYKEDGTHGNYGMIENDKKVFVENVKRIVDQE